MYIVRPLSKFQIMKANFSQVMDRYGLLALFLLASVLERSLSPLLIFPVILRQKQNQGVLSARVTALESQVENSSQTIQSLESQLKKQKKVQEKQEHQIHTQDTRQNKTLSQSDKLATKIRQLELEISSLQEMLAPVPSKVVPIQRQTLMAIDSANLNCAVRDLGIEIDYERLKRYVNTRFGSLEARIYVGEYAGSLKQQAWFNYLRHYGYAIVTKPVTWHGDTPKANVDVDLAVDVFSDGFNFKNVVLCSGDGDYLPVVKKLQQRGIRVIVVNLPGQTNHRLREVADEYISLSEIAAEIRVLQGA